MTDAAQIEQPLRLQLPAALHACVPPLAAVLIDLQAERLTPATAADRLQAEVFAPLRAQLAGQAVVVDRVRIEIAPDGDTITVGDISQAKGVAIGRNANAQVVEGDHNTVVGPGGLNVTVNIGEPQARSGVPFMAPNLPADFVPRPDEFERIVAHLLDSGAGPVAISAALRGAGGYGKTTLAAAVCHDARIRTAFPDGILWVTLGEQPTVADLAGKIDDLTVLLSGGPRIGFVSLEAATTWLAEVLGERRLLLVVDDVWDANHLRPFLRGGPHTPRLITTRNRDTLPAETNSVDVDAMHQTEAVALLGAGMADVAPNTLALRHLAARLGEWPLLLTIVSGVLREQTAMGETLAEAIAYVNAGLDEEGVTVFDTLSAEGRRRAVARTLAVSIVTLNLDEQQRFAELAIFPEDVTIPLATLGRFWGKTGGTSTFAVKRLCTRLHTRSLLLSYDVTQAAIRLHDVVRAYLTYVHSTALASWHAALLDAHWPPSGVWADLLVDEPYLWDHLATHLYAAGLGDELVATAQDLHYLARKLHLRGPLQVAADLRAAEAYAPDDAVLPRLQRTIANACHLFRACPTEHDLAGTFLSRITFDPVVREQAAIFARMIARPYLVPYHPLPDLPDPALLRILEGHTGGVNSCAFGPGGTWLASLSADGTVRLWDVRTGTCQALLAVDDTLTSCAFSPDGQQLTATGYKGIYWLHVVWN